MQYKEKLHVCSISSGFSLFRMYLICDLRALSVAEEPVIVLTHSVISCEDPLPVAERRGKVEDGSIGDWTGYS